MSSTNNSDVTGAMTKFASSLSLAWLHNQIERLTKRQTIMRVGVEETICAFVTMDSNAKVKEIVVKAIYTNLGRGAEFETMKAAGTLELLTPLAKEELVKDALKMQVELHFIKQRLIKLKEAQKELMEEQNHTGDHDHNNDDHNNDDETGNGHTTTV